MTAYTTIDWVFLITPAAFLVVGLIIAAGIELYDEYLGTGGY